MQRFLVLVSEVPNSSVHREVTEQEQWFGCSYSFADVAILAGHQVLVYVRGHKFWLYHCEN